jgi:hypothetical protein
MKTKQSITAKLHTLKREINMDPTHKFKHLSNKFELKLEKWTVNEKQKLFEGI